MKAPLDTSSSLLRFGRSNFRRDPFLRRIARSVAPTFVWILALSLIATAGCQSETSRWEFAHAQLLLNRGRTEEALAQMRTAVAKSGEHWELALPFALELAKQQNRESIAICDRILSQKQVQSNDILLKLARQNKLNCQSQLGDFEDALATLKLILRERIQRDGKSQNDLAYHRALANTQLDMARDEIDSAIQSIASDWCCGERLELADRAKVASALLARYFLAESKNDPSLESIDIAQLRAHESLNFLNQSIDRIEQDFDQVICCDPDGTSEENLIRCTARSNLAVLLAVRALIHQDIGNEVERDRDRLQASQNSNDLEKLLQHLPNEQACFNLLNIATPYLDTRGFVRSKLLALRGTMANAKDVQLTLNDLNVAIFACQTERRAVRGRLGNNINFSVKRVEAQDQYLKRSEAVLRYHRLMALEQRLDFQQAQSDRTEIKQLGFSINHQLY